MRLRHLLHDVFGHALRLADEASVNVAVAILGAVKLAFYPLRRQSGWRGRGSSRTPGAGKHAGIIDSESSHGLLQGWIRR